MRWLSRALAGLALAALAGMAGAAADPPVILSGRTPQLDAHDVAGAWVDLSGKAGLPQAMRAPYEPARIDRIFSLGEQGNLWLHLRLVRPRDELQRWLLVLPMPALDLVTVHQQDARGEWRSESAGDTLAVSTWPEPGRYPHFRLELPPGEPRDVYVRIHHLTPANFPIELLTESAHDQRIQLEYLGLGLTFGALLLLIAACVAQSVVYRDPVYAWYVAYALVTTLGVAAYTGAAAHLLWPGFGALGDAPQGALAMLAAAAAILFVRDLTGIAARYPALDRTVFWIGAAGVALTLAFPLLPKATGLAMLAIYVGGATFMNMVIAFAAWRRGDSVGGWVLLAYMPLSLAVGMALVRMFGWLPVSFGTQYAIVVAVAIEVPLLLVALNLRSRERHGAQIRELALSTQDALTGLLAPHLFHDRLRQVVARYKRSRDNAAVVFIDLVNHAAIKSHYGTAVAEQSLLRTVIKLRRLLRDVDTVSRIGDARFGVILEGVTSRAAVTDRAARLIAAGLMPLKGLKPEVMLQFHVAAVLLRERNGEAPDIVEMLEGVLQGMSPRTRRPIRFVEPENTMPAPLDMDSTIHESAIGAPATGSRPAPLRNASSP